MKQSIYGGEFANADCLYPDPFFLGTFGAQIWPEAKPVKKFFSIAPPFDHSPKIVRGKDDKEYRIEDSVNKNHLNKKRVRKLYHCQIRR